jgi:hypothetical protein
VTATLIRFGFPAVIEAAIGADSLPKERAMPAATDRTTLIRELNDAFRTTLSGGQGYFTSDVAALGDAFCAKALAEVRGFDAFTPDNDPYGEHDFGSIIVADEKLFWKIDYYDLTLHFGSNDPSDSAQTARVLTIMLAEEY